MTHRGLRNALRRSAPTRPVHFPQRLEQCGSCDQRARLWSVGHVTGRAQDGAHRGKKSAVGGGSSPDKPLEMTPESEGAAQARGAADARRPRGTRGAKRIRMTAAGPVRLTPTEARIIEFIERHEGKPCSKAQIAAVLGRNEKTVDACSPACAGRASSYPRPSTRRTARSSPTSTRWLRRRSRSTDERAQGEKNALVGRGVPSAARCPQAPNPCMPRVPSIRELRRCNVAQSCRRVPSVT